MLMALWGIAEAHKSELNAKLDANKLMMSMLAFSLDV